MLQIYNNFFSFVLYCSDNFLLLQIQTRNFLVIYNQPKNLKSMKKLKFVLMAVVATMLVFSACETEDLDAPEITLFGDQVMNLVLNVDTWAEPGFEAIDEQDGDLTSNVIITGDSVDVTRIGVYEITYSVSDKAGNQTSKKRTVNVIVDQDTYVGSWAVTEEITGDNPEPVWNYTATVAKSGVDPNTILVTNFGGYAATFTATVEFDKFGNFTIPNQPLTGSGFYGTMEGEGTTAEDGYTLHIIYDVEYADGDKDRGEGTWVKNK